MSDWNHNEKFVLETLARLDARSEKVAEDVAQLLTMMAIMRQEQERRQWWTRAAIGAALTAVVSAVFNFMHAKP